MVGSGCASRHESKNSTNRSPFSLYRKSGLKRGEANAKDRDEADTKKEPYDGRKNEALSNGASKRGVVVLVQATKHGDDPRARIQVFDHGREGRCVEPCPFEFFQEQGFEPFFNTIVGFRIENVEHFFERIERIGTVARGPEGTACGESRDCPVFNGVEEGGAGDVGESKPHFFACFKVSVGD